MVNKKARVILDRGHCARAGRHRLVTGYTDTDFGWRAGGPVVHWADTGGLGEKIREPAAELATETGTSAIEPGRFVEQACRPMGGTFANYGAAKAA